MLAGRELSAQPHRSSWSLRGNCGTLDAGYDYFARDQVRGGDFGGRRFRNSVLLMLVSITDWTQLYTKASLLQDV